MRLNTKRTRYIHMRSGFFNDTFINQCDDKVDRLEKILWIIVALYEVIRSSFQASTWHFTIVRITLNVDTDVATITIVYRAIVAFALHRYVQCTPVHGITSTY